MVSEKGRGGGGYWFEVSHFFCEGRNSLKNMLSRQEITRSVCEKKKSRPKIHSRKKLEHFSEKKYHPLRLRIFKLVRFTKDPCTFFFTNAPCDFLSTEHVFE